MGRIKRDGLIDILKGLLMLSVVLGHTATALAGGMAFTEQPWRFIPYAGRLFDMPLFMAIAGYFFYFSCMKRDVKTIIGSRVLSIMLPCLAWLWINQAVRFGLHPSGLDWIPQQGLWFLLSLLYCSAITAFLHYGFGRAAVAGALGVAALSLFIRSDSYHVAYMFPFFFGGYAVARYNLARLMKPWMGAAALLLLAIGYGLRFCKVFDGYSVWVSHSYIMGPMGVKRHLLLIAFRLYLGCCGCLAFPWVIRLLYRYCSRRAVLRKRLMPLRNALVILGEYSLSFYCIQSVVVEFICARSVTLLSRHFGHNVLLEHPAVYACVVVPCATVLLLFCCYGVLKLILRSQGLRFVLCGKP